MLAENYWLRLAQFVSHHQKVVAVQGTNFADAVAVGSDVDDVLTAVLSGSNIALVGGAEDVGVALYEVRGAGSGVDGRCGHHLLLLEEMQPVSAGELVSYTLLCRGDGYTLARVIGVCQFV